jgi:GT2 family glycosyltransferase
MPRHHVTLAILSRNRPDFLARALEAARSGQDMPDDILVSDDSDDAVRPQIRELVGRFPGVRYTEGPRVGLGANENHIVANLLPEAQWVVFNGDDARVTDTFMTELRAAISRYDGDRRAPSGTEMRNGVYVRPSRLSFFGFQERPHDDYSPGASLETIVVQATAFPAEVLRQVRWLDVSAYGYDEVDMAYKMRKLGWTLTFEPVLSVIHDQSDTGRDAYPRPLQVARFYFRLRSYSVYDRRPLAVIAFLMLAPLHLAAAQARRRNWRLLSEVPAVTLSAYVAWIRSLRRDWRLG